MKLLEPTGLLLFILGIGICLSPAQQVPNCGDPLSPQATYGGQVAKSNGSQQGTGWPCGKAHGQYGAEWQCVEYVQRLYGEATWTGNAIDYFSAASASKKKLVAFSNPGVVPPVPGDILVYADLNRQNLAGHAAIVTNAPYDKTTKVGKVQVVEQNASDTGVRTHELKDSNGLYTIPDIYVGYKVLGWLHKPSQLWKWISFAEGNPGVPGDGTVIDANLGKVQLAFELATPIALRDYTGGFTYTAFFPSGTPQLRYVQLGISNLQTSGSCQISFEYRPTPSGNVSYGNTIRNGVILSDGVPGIFTNVSSSDLNSIVAFVNQGNPACTSVTLNDLYFDHLLLEVANPSSFWPTLDAAAVGSGPNNFPGIEVP